MLFQKEHLNTDHNYTWADETVFEGTPTRRLFDRHNGNQILFIINLYASETKMMSRDDVAVIEKMIADKMPIEIKSEISALKWLQENVVLSLQ